MGGEPVSIHNAAENDIVAGEATTWQLRLLFSLADAEGESLCSLCTSLHCFKSMYCPDLNFLSDVARGSYVWIGLEVTESNIFEWEDGSRFSYAKFVPSGNSMLKRRFPGAGIFVRNSYLYRYLRESTMSYLLPTRKIRSEIGRKTFANITAIRLVLFE